MIRRGPANAKPKGAHLRRDGNAGRCLLQEADDFPRDRSAAQTPYRVGWKRMRIEFYRVVYWVGVAAFVAWTVYSAYSAFIFS
jgi:hypothetical protein